MKLNNRGMTLIELIVAFAILGVMSVSVFGILLTSTKTYTKMTSSVKLQYETQLTMANIERRIMNCNEGITWGNATVTNDENKKELFLVNEENGKKTLQVIYHKNITDELYYGTGELTAEGSLNLTFYLLAEHVDEMKVKLVTTVSPEDGLTYVKQVQLSLTMSQNNITYTGEKTIALRNQPSGDYQWKLSLGAGNGTVTKGDLMVTPTVEPTVTPE